MKSHYITERSKTRTITLCHIKAKSVTYRLFYNIHRACGAIVIDIVITINTVLWFNVLNDQPGNLFSLNRIKINISLQNIPSLTFVCIYEAIGRTCSRHIIGLSFDETVNKIWRIEIEHPPIDHEFPIFRMIDEQAGVPLKLIYIAARTTYQH